MSHWYEKNGRPCYTVIGANGKERDTTLRDARKLDLVPSVTTILKVASSDALTEWRINEALKLAAERPFDPISGIAENWIKDIKGSCKDTLRVSSEKGSAIHDSLEDFYKNGIVSQKYSYIVLAVEKLLYKEFGNINWVAEEAFGYEGMFGGKVDLHAKTDNLDIILDFKTKTTKDFDSVKGYSNHKMQLAAYAKGLQIPAATTGNVWIDTIDEGQVKLEMYSMPEKEKAWEMFQHLYQYWKYDNNFNL